MVNVHKISRETLPALEQFERWPYPKMDGFPGGLFSGVRKDIEICQDHNVIWPERPYCPDLNILVAGCGTTEAAAIAFDNPRSRVLGVDFSEESLRRANDLRKRYRLENLQLACLDIRERATELRAFDLIITTGVVHHLPEPHKALASLGSALKPDGAMVISIYRRIPRTGVYLVQEALRTMQVGYSPEEVRFTRQVLSELPASHQLFANTPRELLLDGDDTDLVDTFLNRHDHAFSVHEVIKMIGQSGLTFQNWYDNLDYFPDGHLTKNSVLAERLSGLSVVDQWSVIELLYQTTGRHRFVVRPGDYQVVDVHRLLIEGKAGALRPTLRRDLRLLQGRGGRTTLTREWQKRILTSLETHILAQCDGRRCIDDIADVLSQGPTSEVLDTLGSLWRCGHIVFDAARHAEAQLVGVRDDS